MARFLLVSGRSSNHLPSLDTLVSLLRIVWRLDEAEQASLIKMSSADSHVLILKERIDDVHVSGDSVCALRSATAYMCDSLQRVNSSMLLSGFLSRGIRAIEDLAPPSGVLVTSDRCKWYLTVDHCGLQHLYWAKADGYVLASSSAIVAAAVTRQRLDVESMLILSRLGWLVNGRTLFRGVNKILPSKHMLIQSGCISLCSRLSSESTNCANDGQISFDKDAFHVVMRNTAQRLATAYPEASVELSGGIDSRLILAALGPCAKGMSALTMQSCENADYAIARLLAKQAGCCHCVVDLDRLIQNELVHFSASRLEEAAIQSDGIRNPLFSVLFERVNDAAPDGPRFSGQGGEILRGFYYKGQPDYPISSVERLNALVDWRLTINESVQPTALSKDALGDARKVVYTEIDRVISEGEGSWRRRLDYLYLQGRMQNLVGGAMSAASKRCILAPFFLPSIVNISRRAPIDLLADSKLVLRAICTLDPALGRISLSGGVSPRQCVENGILLRMRKVAADATKLVRRIYERMCQRGRPGVGVSMIAAALSKKLISDDVLEVAGRQGIFDVHNVRQMASTGTLGPTTLGFVLSTVSVHRLLEKCDCQP